MAERITVARILRPHGIRGEVAAEVLTDFPEKLKRLASAELRDGRSGAGSHPPRQVKIRSCWLSHSRGGQAIFHFAGSNSISDAGRLVGRDVQIMGEQVNGTPILRVDSPQGELLIPLAQEICVRVDTEARTIEVVLPE